VKKTIACKKCESEFPSWGPAQANGCAAEVHDGRIFGHYGSAHDLSEYLFVGEPLPDMNPICDECIDELLAKVLIVYRREYLDFDQCFSTPCAGMN
jgi:hypothetical protein